MTDPFDALRAPVVPVDPDRTFAANLRARLERALLEQKGTTMSTDTTATDARTEPAWPPDLVPYLAVDDAPRALDWYVDVFAAEQRGDPYVMPDGTIGHAELGIGDAVLMLASGDPAEGVVPPSAKAPVNQSIYAQVPDADATVRRAVERGAELVRPVGDEPYGRSGVIRDPFGHRWIVNTPPAAATKSRLGDIAYVTVATPDAARAQAFYGAVLGWRFAPGSVEEGFQVQGTQPMTGLAGGRDLEVLLCYRVGDLDAAIARVREHGGQADEPVDKPYGRLVDCIDDQGMRFELLAPPTG